MGQSAYIKFVEGSEVQSLTIDEVREQLDIYLEQTAKTGKQLGWDYSEAAFPYTIETKPESEGKWFYLKGKNENYKYIIFGVGNEVRQVEEEQVKVKDRSEDDDENESEDAEVQQPTEQVIHYVQVVLPENCTHGDKSKANEYCKFIAKRLKAELHLFNGRVLYYNPRKL